MNTNLSPKQISTLESAQRYFNDGHYDKATPLLNSLVAQKTMSADVYHMLGTINYEQGQFKASIVSFKKALHIDPYFTDSSIGLSVVLNDLGKYDHAQEIFLDAQKKLKEKNSVQGTADLNSEIAQKHFELCKLYKKADQIDLAFQSFLKYEELQTESFETLVEKAKLQRMLSNFSFAAEILKSWWVQNPNIQKAEFFIELAELLYLDRKVVAALTTCEQGLKVFPQNQDLLKLKNSLTNTEFDLKPMEI